MQETKRTNEGKQPSNRWYLLLPVLLILAVVVYVTTDNDERLVPVALGELRLSERLSGAAAQELINHLHAKGVAPERNEVGFYRGPGGNATLYVSVYSTEANAAEAELQMARRIRQGNPIFGEYKERTVAGKRVSECYGMDQVHYFFSHDVRLYWLGVDPPRAEETLEELLRLLAQ
jgi:hypothetical protein